MNLPNTLKGPRVSENVVIFLENLHYWFSIKNVKTINKHNVGKKYVFLELKDF